MLSNIETYFFVFLTYAIAGWIMETLGGIIKNKKFVNRGFLIGPYCPIYGVGILLLTFLLKRYQSDWILVFFLSLLICGALEYYTSFLMEKIFHARWWDYSKRKFNINGRICLETLIPFGIAGSLIINIINPYLIKGISFVPSILLHISFGMILVLFIVDIIISFKIIIEFKNITKNIKDNTEEISARVKEKTKEISEIVKEKKEKIDLKVKDTAEELNKKVRDIISQKSILHKRLLKAFPELDAKKIKKNKRN